MKFEEVREGYKALWEMVPQNVYVDLSTIWMQHKGDVKDFEDFIRLGIDYNVAAVAFFLYKHSKDFSYVSPILLDKVEQLCQELVSCEGECKKEKAALLWETLVLSWDEENEERVEALLKQLFDITVVITEDMDWRQKKIILDKGIDVFLEPMNAKSLPFPSSDTYIRSVYVLSKLVDVIELTGKEVYYDIVLYMDKIDDFTKSLTKRYISFLFQNQHYRTCAAFLRKLKNVDYVEIFDKSEEEFWLELLKPGDIYLLEVFQKIKGYISEEGLIQWREYMHQHVAQEDSLAWCDWKCYLSRMVLTLDAQSTTWEEFYQKAEQELPDSPYPWETTENRKRIVGAFQYIFSEIFRRDWNVLPILSLWGENNLYNYQHRYFIRTNKGANIKFLDKSRFHDWEANYTAFISHSYTPEEKVLIYMNTPLRLAIEFRDFVAMIAKEAGNENVGLLFDAYRLDGYLSYTDILSSARGRMRFELDSKCIYTKYYYKSRRKKDVSHYNSLLFLEENWYRKHENEIREMKRDSKATFKLWGYGSLGRNEGTVLVYDVQDFECDEIDPQKEMNDILEWIYKITAEHKYIPITKEDFIYVYPLSKLHLNETFAVAILEAINALRKSPQEVTKFLRDINHGRLDKISEFQYLLTHTTVQTIWIEDFPSFIKNVKRIAHNICVETNLTNVQKCNIYMNTCLKVFYPLPLFWSKIHATEEDMISLASRSNELNHFMFLTEYEGVINGDGKFKLAPNVNIKDYFGKDAPFAWKWKGQSMPQEKIGELFRVTIKEIDLDEKTIWIGAVMQKDVTDAWGDLIKRIMDLKLNPSLTYVDSIRKEIETAKMDYFVKNRVAQLAKVFQTLFNRSGKVEYTDEYNLFWCTQIINVFGEGNNPFMQKEKVQAMNIISEDEVKKIKEGCTFFLEERKRELECNPNSFSMRELEEFFVRSPYNLVYTKEEFVNLAEQIFE